MRWVETLQRIWHLASFKGGIIRHVTKMQEAEHILLAEYARSFTAGLQESLPAGVMSGSSAVSHSFSHIASNLLSNLLS